MRYDGLTPEPERSCLYKRTYTPAQRFTPRHVVVSHVPLQSLKSYTIVISIHATGQLRPLCLDLTQTPVLCQSAYHHALPVTLRKTFTTGSLVLIHPALAVIRACVVNVLTYVLRLPTPTCIVYRPDVLPKLVNTIPHFD